MLMQSETRWSGPPPDLMVPSVLVNVLANAILSGEQEKDALVTRLGQPRLEHYHYRMLAKATGSIRLIETPKPRLKKRRLLPMNKK
jgi:hypothetical protein